MAHRSFKVAGVFALAAFACAGLAHPFGRFGFVKHWRFVGLQANATGFGNELKTSCELQFESPSPSWEPTFTSPYQQFVKLAGGENLPSRLSANLLSGQMGAFFAKGLRLKLTDSSTPYLTWPDGSVAPGVPTPKANWLLLSWERAQPPLFICFGAGQLHSLQITGGPGNWILEAEKGFSGWVRIAAPFGDKPFATNSAGSLGAMANEFTKVSPFWLGEPASLRGIRQVAYNDGVLGDWEFTGNAIIPAPVVIAQNNGYPLVAISGFTRTGYSTEDGPLLISTEPRLKVRFPLLPAPEGRAVRPIPMPPVDYTNPLQLLFAEGGQDALQKVNAAAVKTFSGANFVIEPFTRDQILFDETGKGLQSNADLALMDQLTTPFSKQNPFLVGQSWGQDWLTWRPSTTNADSSSLDPACLTACIAAAYSSNAALKLFGATQVAGLWCSWKTLPATIPIDQTAWIARIYNLRYSESGVSKPIPSSPLAAQLFDAPIRILSGQKMWFTPAANGGETLDWNADGDRSRIRIWIKNGFEATYQGLPIKTSDYNDKGRYFSFVMQGARSGEIVIQKETPAVPKP